eukprot:Hpha_TRINITY_DN15806_c1_g2::TRINITY_DN15806_c1_g2_i1::g.188261::m.188261
MLRVKGTLELHGGVTNLSARHEGLLRGTGRDPAGHVLQRPGLVIRTAGTRPTERLLGDDRASALVVHVPVSGGVLQPLVRLCDDIAILAPDGSREGVATGVVDFVQGVFPLVVLEYVAGEHWAEDLIGEHRRPRVGGVHNRGRNEPALRVVALVVTTGQHLAVVRLVRLPKVVGDVAERLFVDDGTHEVLEVSHITHLDGLNMRHQLVPERGPQRTRDVDAGARRALLSLVLERRPHGAGSRRVDVGCHVEKVEVLSTSLTNQPGVASVGVDVRPDLVPDRRERARGSCEAHGGHGGVRNDVVNNVRGIAGNHVDNARGQPSLLEDLQHQVVTEDGRIARLPHDCVAHQRGSSGQVNTDRREIEGRDREDEPLQRTVVDEVPGVVGGDRLLSVDLLGVLAVEAKEVDCLHCRVDLRLPDGL